MRFQKSKVNQEFHKNVEGINEFTVKNRVFEQNRFSSKQVKPFRNPIQDCIFSTKTDKI